MMIIELREAAYNKAFELLEEIKDLGKKKKMAICELEDAMYECYEASKDKSEFSESEPGSVSDIEFRRRSGMRRGMRHEYDEEYEPYRYDHGMRMRNYRSGRYSY